MAEQCTDPTCEDWRIPHPPHDTCRRQLNHADRHTCDGRCALAVGHTHRHRCAVEVEQDAAGYPGGEAT